MIEDEFTIKFRSFCQPPDQIIYWLKSTSIIFSSCCRFRSTWRSFFLPILGLALNSLQWRGYFLLWLDDDRKLLTIGCREHFKRLARGADTLAGWGVRTFIDGVYKSNCMWAHVWFFSYMCFRLRIEGLFDFLRLDRGFGLEEADTC